MDRIAMYEKLLAFGNKEIAYMSTRSLLPDTPNRAVSIDTNRLRSELELYRYRKEKGFPSLISFLMPIILANTSVEHSFEQALKLIKLVRKEVTLENKIGLQLLCHLLSDAEEFERNFSSYTLTNASKEEELKFQKIKISIILKQKSVSDVILENLEEQDKESNSDLLSSLNEERSAEADEMMQRMQAYFSKVCRFEIAVKGFEGQFDIRNFFNKKKGDRGNDSLLGSFEVLDRFSDGCLDLLCKRGRIEIWLPIANKSAGSSRGKEYESSNHADRGRIGNKNPSGYEETNPEELLRRFAFEKIKPKWQKVIREELSKEYFSNLLQDIDRQYRTERIFPQQQQVFRSFIETDFDDVKVVILGQDPYHGAGQANGLCFSVNEGVDPPPSLVNIFKELEQEYGRKRSSVDLIDWAKQGVLLLNSVLTVREATAGSHAKLGWERFTDEIVATLSRREEPIVFILWGSYAIEKAKSVDSDRHLILKSPHPSPLSCHRGFFGNRHFVSANEFLNRHDRKEIIWV